MKREEFKQALTELRQAAGKRNFKQSVDLIINLKNLDLKKPDHQVDLFVQLPHERGKDIKICLLSGPEMDSQKQVVDGHLLLGDFEKYSKKQDAKKLATQYDFFVAQASLMTNVAKAFGRVFGPKGKMPNPKAGCVVPPNANLTPLVQRLKKTIRITAKTQPAIRCSVGKEDSDDEQLIDNALKIYTSVLNKLPQEENNIRNVLLKLTMSKPARVGQTKKEE